MQYIFLYDNLDIYNPFITVRLLVWSLFAGFIFAALLAIYQKRLIGGLVKTILSEGASSPETAKTVSELGYASDWFAKNALRKDDALLRFVVRVDKQSEDGEAVEPKKTRSGHDVVDFETARFYIPEDLRYKAEVRYARKGTDFVSFGICIIVFIAAAFFAIFVIPELLQLIDNFIGTFK